MWGVARFREKSMVRSATCNVMDAVRSGSSANNARRWVAAISEWCARSASPSAVVNALAGRSDEEDPVARPTLLLTGRP